MLRSTVKMLEEEVSAFAEKENSYIEKIVRLTVNPSLDQQESRTG